MPPTTSQRFARRSHDGSRRPSPPRLNPDDVAQERFGDWNSPTAVLEAARWTTRRREELLAERRSRAFETVFSARDKVEFVARAVAADYFVRVFFVGTDDPAINAARVAHRVMAGGHSVPVDKIVARYGKSLANLQAVIRIAQRVYVFDNTSTTNPRAFVRGRRMARCGASIRALSLTLATRHA